MDNFGIVKLAVGILGVQVSAKVLKKLIRQKRPYPLSKYSKTYGMPSSRSAIVFYIITFLILSLEKGYDKRILLILISVGLFSAALKYIMREHTFTQLLSGASMGIFMGYLIKKIKF